MERDHSKTRKGSFSEDEQKFYSIIKGRRVIGTRFFDVPTLETLGLREVVEKFLGNAGLGGYMYVNAKAYKELTFSFLSTFKWTKDAHGDFDVLVFKYEKKIYRVNVAQIKEVLGITRDCVRGWERGGMNVDEMNDFWSKATRGKYRAGHEKNSSFTHPCLRIVHKLLKSTFFGQKEDTKIATKDFMHFLSVLPDNEAVPDWVDILTQSMERLRSKEVGSDIMMGGLITLIASKAFNVEGLPDPIAPLLMNDVEMKRAKMLEITGRKYVLISGQKCEHKFRLPRPMPYGGAWEEYYIPSAEETGEELAQPLGSTKFHLERRRMEAGGSSGVGDDDEVEREDVEMPDSETGEPRVNPWDQYSQPQYDWSSFQSGVFDRFTSLSTRLDKVEAGHLRHREEDREERRLDREESKRRWDAQDEMLRKMYEESHAYYGRFPPPGPPHLG